uniref:Uncharacterized protein n=1 Tax=gamma proteobacterium 10BT TaxID=1778877 RepID=A0A140D6A0_9GAMM|nr:hypothetical protein [gamma proteobacterium 10BT]
MDSTVAAETLCPLKRYAQKQFFVIMTVVGVPPEMGIDTFNTCFNITAKINPVPGYRFFSYY